FRHFLLKKVRWCLRFAATGPENRIVPIAASSILLKKSANPSLKANGGLDTSRSHLRSFL
ncbi:MAG: hypothetical protein V4641_13725, partial [Pseudomonadota bacterium]